MGKYEKIGVLLTNEKSNEIMYSFKEIEEILGFPLPQSAKLYRPWWANDSTHVQALDGWLNNGWKVSSVDMDKQIVVFNRHGKRLKNQHGINKQSTINTPAEFENQVRIVMSNYFKKNLSPGQISDIPKLFDMISEDKKIVGDAKFLTMVKGKFLPPAKFSIIAEHVWLLEKTDATEKFLIFGNDRRVPESWLKKFGKYVHDVDFFFYETRNNELEKLNKKFVLKAS